ncbi:hypothetical protein L1887_57744 [Cichorium endivia]|nr:hypothetical protein L1887_57744 [Cichorium endivia]
MVRCPARQSSLSLHPCKHWLTLSCSLRRLLLAHTKPRYGQRLTPRLTTEACSFLPSAPAKATAAHGNMATTPSAPTLAAQGHAMPSQLSYPQHSPNPSHAHISGGQNAGPHVDVRLRVHHSSPQQHYSHVPGQAAHGGDGWHGRRRRFQPHDGCARRRLFGQRLSTTASVSSRTTTSTSSPRTSRASRPVRRVHPLRRPTPPRLLPPTLPARLAAKGSAKAAKGAKAPKAPKAPKADKKGAAAAAPPAKAAPEPKGKASKKGASADAPKPSPRPIPMRSPNPPLTPSPPRSRRRRTRRNRRRSSRASSRPSRRRRPGRSSSPKSSRRSRLKVPTNASTSPTSPKMQASDTPRFPSPRSRSSTAAALRPRSCGSRRMSRLEGQAHARGHPPGESLPIRPAQGRQVEERQPQGPQRSQEAPVRLLPLPPRHPCRSQHDAGGLRGRAGDDQAERARRRQVAQPQRDREAALLGSRRGRQGTLRATPPRVREQQRPRVVSCPLSSTLRCMHRQASPRVLVTSPARSKEAPHLCRPADLLSLSASSSLCQVHPRPLSAGLLARWPTVTALPRVFSLHLATLPAADLNDGLACMKIRNVSRFLRDGRRKSLGKSDDHDGGVVGAEFAESVLDELFGGLLWILDVADPVDCFLERAGTYAIACNDEEAVFATEHGLGSVGRTDDKLLHVRSTARVSPTLAVCTAPSWPLVSAGPVRRGHWIRSGFEILPHRPVPDWARSVVPSAAGAVSSEDAWSPFEPASSFDPQKRHGSSAAARGARLRSKVRELLVDRMECGIEQIRHGLFRAAADVCQKLLWQTNVERVSSVFRLGRRGESVPHPRTHLMKVSAAPFCRIFARMSIEYTKEALAGNVAKVIDKGMCIFHRPSKP